MRPGDYNTTTREINQGGAHSRKLYQVMIITVTCCINSGTTLQLAVPACVTTCPDSMGNTILKGEALRVPVA